MLPGLTLSRVISALGLSRREAIRRRELEARVKLARAALRRAEQLAERDELPERAVERAREIYELRIQRLGAQLGQEDSDGNEDPDAYRRIRREMVAAERQALEDLRSERKLGSGLIREIERDLDFDDSRLSR